MFYFSLALFAARLLIAAWVLFPHTYTHMQSHMYMCACVGIRYTDESPNECTLGPSILCARTGIFIWCHFNFPAFSFYRRNENESNGKKGSIQRCSSSIRQQQQQEHEEEEEEEAEEQLLIVVCHFWLGCFVASVLPLGLRWRAMRLLFVGCCPFFLSVCVCVCVCQLDTVQRVVQSPLQITCGSVKQKRWQLCDSVAPCFTPGDNNDDPSGPTGHNLMDSPHRQCTRCLLLHDTLR